MGCPGLCQVISRLLFLILKSCIALLPMAELEERVAHCDISLNSKAHVQHDGAWNIVLGDLVKLLDTHLSAPCGRWVVGR